MEPTDGDGQGKNLADEVDGDDNPPEEEETDKAQMHRQPAQPSARQIATGAPDRRAVCLLGSLVACWGDLYRNCIVCDIRSRLSCCFACLSLTRCTLVSLHAHGPFGGRGFLWAVKFARGEYTLVHAGQASERALLPYASCGIKWPSPAAFAFASRSLLDCHRSCLECQAKQALEKKGLVKKH